MFIRCCIWGSNISARITQWACSIMCRLLEMLRTCYCESDTKPFLSCYRAFTSYSCTDKFVPSFSLFLSEKRFDNITRCLLKRENWQTNQAKRIISWMKINVEFIMAEDSTYPLALPTHQIVQQSASEKLQLLPWERSPPCVLSSQCRPHSRILYIHYIAEI